MNGCSGEIVFLDSEGECDVTAVYGRVVQETGNYSVTVSREDDDWYEVWGHDIYAKTLACLSLAVAWSPPTRTRGVRNRTKSL